MDFKIVHNERCGMGKNTGNRRSRIHDTLNTIEDVKEHIEQHRDHTIMKSRELFGDKKRQITHYVLITIATIFVAAYLVMKTLSTGTAMGQIAIGGITFHLENVPMILMSGIVGFMPAMVAFALAFVNILVLDFSQAYAVFIYLIAAIIAFFAVQAGWYSGKKQQLAWLVVVFAFVIGDVYAVLEVIVSASGFSYFSPAQFLFSFIGELPECALSVALTYAFFHYVPDRYKTLTFNGFYYAEGRNKDRQERFLRNSRLSRCVTALIATEGMILGVAAIGFANALMPLMADDVIGNVEGFFWSDLMDLGKENKNTVMVEDEQTGNVIVVDGNPSKTGNDAQNNDRQSGDSDAAAGNSAGADNAAVTEDGSGVDNTTAAEDGSGADNAAADNEDSTGTSGTQGKRRPVNEDTGAHLEGHMRFVMNKSGLAFDLKLLMMIMNTLIPLTVFANAYAQRRIVRPITSMAATIRDFCDVEDEQREGELKKVKDLPITNDDEIGELYAELSNMAAKITGFVDEMREKERLQADLVIARKSSENKSRFLSSVSHELRTPINAVLGLDEMILRESTDEAILAYASDIQSAGKSLLGLVNDILDSSKLEEGKMDIIATEYELSSMINDLINMIAVKAKDKNLEFFVNVDENTPHLLYGDEVRLKQVIINILTNAVKYTQAGSVTMSVGFERIDETRINLMVSVKDTGIGIREEDMKKLFSRFERIEEERNKNIEGTGLGMSIVKQLLHLMGTDLVVESVYGEGSEFSFGVVQQVTKWVPIGSFSEMYRNAAARNEAYHATFIAPSARVLVVDDTTMNLTVAKGLLKKTLIQIDTAQSGAETLELIKKIKYDIIFLDHRMPEMDGTETLHRMEALEDNLCAGVPVIILTANAVSGSRENFLNEGFTDYLAKPIDSVRLEEMVRTYLPPELVIDEADDRYAAYMEEATSSSDAGGADFSAGMERKPSQMDTEGRYSQTFSPLAGITSIDYETAIKNCGSEELLMEVLKDYLEAVPAKAADISRFLEAGDYQNYTILVHALKSSSRLIGALQLSADAAHLEKCGDLAKQGDADAAREIAEKTPGLLKMYRSYYDKITPLVMGADDTDARPEIPEEELAEAFAAIREFVEAFDFDSADSVMAQLSDYRMPAGEEETFLQVKKCLSAVDREELLRLL